MTEETRQRYIAEIQNMCLMDDIFFCRFFDENIECTQYVLRIIMDKPDLIVKSAKSQFNVENIHGRGIRLDVLAVDSAGKLYNIEVQRKDDGAVPQRARYNSSLLDADNLEKGAKFKNLPETFVIFITENDVLKGGEQIYHIERVVKETGKNFGDGSHIVYVNGSMRGGSALGDLMHDFFCRNTSAINSKLLAARTDFIKNNEKEVQGMSEFIERMMSGYSERIKEESRTENLLENIRALMDSLQSTAEEAMNLLKIPPEKQKELAPLI